MTNLEYIVPPQNVILEIPGFQLNGIFPYAICKIHLESSRQFVAFNFGTSIVVRIDSNLYLFIVVSSLECIVTTQQYSVVTWY